MRDKLTKPQRIYLRDALFNKQNGKCHFCGAELAILRPGVMLAANWRRASLTAIDGRWRVSCQPCSADGNGITNVISEQEKADLDQLIAD